MGKGSRNRQLHLQESTGAPANERKTKKSNLSTWIASAVAILLVVAMIGIAVANIISDSGMIERNRIMIKSQTGEFDLDQHAATFAIWYTTYNYYYQIYSMYSSGSSESDILSNALGYACSMVEKGNLRDSFENMEKELKAYVAVCDEAYRRGITLDDADMEQVNATMDGLTTIAYAQQANSLNTFLSALVSEGMKEKDARRVVEMLSLYSKYYSTKKTEMEGAVTADELAAYRDENPASYYNTSYLAYKVTEEADRDALLAAKTPDEFKTVIIDKLFDKNYTDAYREAIVIPAVNNLYVKIKNKADTAETPALTNGLNEIGATAAASFAKEGSDLPKEVIDWMFGERKAYDTACLKTETGYYLIAFFEKNEEAKTVTVRYLHYEFPDESSYESDTAFRENMKNYILALNLKKDLPKVTYSSSLKQAEALRDQLKAEGADPTLIMKNVNALRDIKIDVASTDAPDLIVATVTNKEAPAKAGDILVIPDEDNVHTYTVYVSDVSAETYTISYKEYENDMFFRIESAVQEAITKLMPTEKTEAYKATPEAGSAAEWLIACNEKFVPTASANAVKAFEIKEKDSATNTEKVTGYNVYFITEPLHVKEKWEESAKTGAVNKKMTEWIESIAASYELNKLDKLPEPATTEEATEAATA